MDKSNNVFYQQNRDATFKYILDYLQFVRHFGAEVNSCLLTPQTRNPKTNNSYKFELKKR